MKRKKDAGYNERFFGGGIRRWLHLARFSWTERALCKAGAECARVLELGCYDGRAVSFLTREPELYVGLDANWEGGLAMARERFAGNDRFEFYDCHSPDDLRDQMAGRVFDTGLCLETLEHIDADLVDSYVRALSEGVKGVLVITVPNEKGFVFLVKFLAKRLFADSYSYSLKEVFFATMGMMNKVERNQHKGFDYEAVIAAVRKHFDVLEVSPYPFRHLPRSAGFGVGILAKAK